MESTVLVKAFALLEALSAAQRAMPLATLAEQCGLAKPTAHRVLGDLARMGYVQRVSTGVYRLSEKFQRLAAGREAALVAAAEPILEQLQARADETINLGVMRRDRVVYLRVLESRHALRRVAGPDSVDPIHSTALGRAIVSRLPESAWDRVLADVLREGRTPRTVTDPDELRRVFRRAKRNGYAEEVDENDLGVMCLAAPVCDAEGVAAAISISAPSARVDRQRRRDLIAALLESTQQLHQTLTQTEPVPA